MAEVMGTRGRICWARPYGFVGVEGVGLGWVNRPHPIRTDVHIYQHIFHNHASTHVHSGA